jgi:hypothetical protein
MVVQSRSWSGEMWFYVCTPVNPEDRTATLPFPEVMLKKLKRRS